MPPTRSNKLHASDPLIKFRDWFVLAQARARDARRVVLATHGSDCAPNARVVYLRLNDAQGLHFFTNYQSQKGQELEQNPQVAGVVFWEELGQQVRFRGRVKRCDPKTSDEYFSARPLGSRFASVWSKQSRPIKDLEQLRSKVARAVADAEPAPSRPEHWGGYAIDAHEWEFWTRGEHRVHERVAFSRKPKGGWSKVTLHP